MLVGSSLKADKPTVEGEKIQPGSQLTAYGKSVTDTTGIWLPIVPPPTERRYIEAKNVAMVSSPVTTTSAAPPLASGANFQPQPAVPQAGNADPLLIQAQQDEQQGRYAEASQLYTELGKRLANVDHAKAVEYQNRAYQLSAQPGSRRRGPSVDPAEPERPAWRQDRADSFLPVRPAGGMRAEPTAFPTPRPMPPANPQTQQVAYGQSTRRSRRTSLAAFRSPARSLPASEHFSLLGARVNRSPTSRDNQASTSIPS